VSWRDRAVSADEPTAPVSGWRARAVSDNQPEPDSPPLLNTLGQAALAGAKSAFTAPYDATRYAMQNPDKINDQLPVLGAVAGSTLAPGIGTAAGAGLGQIGKRLADLLYGKVQPADAMNPMKEAAGPMIQAAAGGLPETAPAMALASKVGSGLAKVGSAFSGAKASDLTRAASKGYSTYAAPSMEDASSQFGAALEKAGIKSDPSLESAIDPQLTQARQTALTLGKKLQSGEAQPLPTYQPGTMTEPHAVFQGNFDFGPDAKYSTYILRGNHPRAGSNFDAKQITDMGIPVVGAEGKGIGQIHDLAQPGLSPQEALQGRQAVDRIIAGTPQKDKPTLLQLGKIRDQFNEALANSSPEVSQASSDYADAILKRNLTKVMPVNKGGEYSKLAPYLAAAAGSAVGYGHHNTGEGALAGGAYLLGTSPLAMGAAATTMGAISPQMRAAALSAFVDRILNKRDIQ